MSEKENKVTTEVTESKAAKAPAKVKKDKVSFGKKISKAWKEFKAEFKKIVWSSKRATFNNTVLVVVCMVVVSAVVGAMDFGFGKLLNWIARLV